jgi:hypothetical protein
METSVVNDRYAYVPETVIGDGRAVPDKDATWVEAVDGPSCILKKSQHASVLKLEKVSRTTALGYGLRPRGSRDANDNRTHREPRSHEESRQRRHR